MKRVIPCLVLLFTFCNKLPIGEEELTLRGDFTAQYVELSPYLNLTEYRNITLGTSSNLIVGKNNEYESRILLKFGFPDSVSEGLDEIKLILYRNERFKKDTITFSIHLLTARFEETEATWLKKTNIEAWSTQGGDFEEDSIRFGEISADSLLVFFNYIELDKIRTADGLIIIPEDSGFVGFYSKEGGNAPKFQLVKNNSVTSIPIQADCYILTGPEPFYIESWVGSGMAYRNYLKFNYDTLLNDKKAVYAELTLKPEKYFSMRDSIEIGVKELLEPLNGFNTPTGPIIALEKFAVDDTLFSIDVVRHVQRIIDYPDSNFGFFIYLSPETYDISNIKFITNLHHLKIGYITPPQER